MSSYLHIVCLDAPSPPDYGGAIDLYYKIKALAQAGRKIILHYFSYKKSRGVKGIEDYCEAVYAYNRKNILSSFATGLPYIVASRISNKLITRLNEDAHPILLEGFHCCGLLPYLKGRGRSIVCRVHNNEAAYYHQLQKAENNLLRKAYFNLEGKKLARFQYQLERNLPLACISEDDHNYFLQQGFSHSFFLPAFLPWQEITCKTGRGNYCLYHGNLSVSENVKAVEWLLQAVFRHLEVPIIVAGKSIPETMLKAWRHQKNVSFVNHPSEAAMKQLVENAQVHVLPSFNSTGVKLKLLHALFNGRHCLINKAAAGGSRVETGVFLAESAPEFQQQIIRCMSLPFLEKDKDLRRQILTPYNNVVNAEKLNASLL